jgi:hypothetical protein
MPRHTEGPVGSALLALYETVCGALVEVFSLGCEALLLSQMMMIED